MLLPDQRIRCDRKKLIPIVRSERPKLDAVRLLDVVEDQTTSLIARITLTRINAALKANFPSTDLAAMDY